MNRIQLAAATLPIFVVSMDSTGGQVLHSVLVNQLSLNVLWMQADQVYDLLVSTVTFFSGMG